MVLTSVAALLLSPDIALVTVVAALAAIAFSWFFESDRVQLVRFTAFWKFATVGFLVFLVLNTAIGDMSLINAGVYFLLFVLVNKLFNRRTSRDYLQAYVISFMMMVGATALNTSLSYAICFLGYIVFGTWAMILLHLRREVESNYLENGDQQPEGDETVRADRILNSRRIISGRFLLGTSALSLVMALSASLIFILFPRMGLGFFSSLKRQGVSMAGFSESVQLGTHGTIRDNPRVVMRVIFGDENRRTDPPPLETLRWRGSAYETYAAGRWHHSTALGLDNVADNVMPVEGMYVLFAPGPPLPLRLGPKRLQSLTLKQRIYLEPLPTTILFGADRPLAIEMDKTRLHLGKKRVVPRRGVHHEIRLSRLRTSGIRYTVYSQVDRPTPAMLRQSDPIHMQSMAHFLQLPETLSQRARDLAQRITHNKVTIYDKAVAVESYLQENYEYTLDLPPTRSGDPIDAFLFETKKGHCEFFASAMAILLRAVGIHTRQVNGFLGGQWNEYGNYLAVRQGDAHAWVEVLFDQQGWVAFDPTPPRSRPSGGASGVLQSIRQMIDTLRLRWFNYVIEYNLEKQINAAKSIGRAFSRVNKKGVVTPSSLRRYRRTLIIGGILIAVFVLFLYKRRKAIERVGRGRKKLKEHPATAYYGQVLRMLQSHRHSKASNWTPLEYCDRLQRQGFPALDSINEFTRAYYALRFDTKPWSKGRERELRAAVRRLKSDLTRVKRPS